MLASVCNDGCSRRESAHQGAHGQIAHTSLVVYFMQRADCIPTPLVFQSIEVLVSVTLRLLSVEDMRQILYSELSFLCGVTAIPL